MSNSDKSPLQTLLIGVAWLLFVIAALTFWFGGGLIREITKTNRILAELEGIGLAATLGLGAVAKFAAKSTPAGDQDHVGRSS